MLGSLGLYWWLLKAVLAIWSLCWSHFGQLGALLVASEGYIGRFGSRVGTMLGSLGLCWRLLKAMLGALAAIWGLCWAAWGSLGGL